MVSCRYVARGRALRCAFGLPVERRDIVFGFTLRPRRRLDYARERSVDGRAGRSWDVLPSGGLCQIEGIAVAHVSALRIISSSGAPLQPTVKSQVENLFGMVLHNGYGVTECSPNISQAVVGERRTDTSVGRVLPGVEVQLVGSDQKAVAEGEVGELWVRGPNVMKGYYHSLEETAVAINSEGWFNTRDLARLENGYLFIVGRTKELIVRFGENVYPGEVEAVLNAHPAVVRSAVIGRTVEGTEGGEEVVAFVQLSPSSPITEAELAQHAAQHLAPYKRPSQILLVSSMPLTPTGKIIKSELVRVPHLSKA